METSHVRNPLGLPLSCERAGVGHASEAELSAYSPSPAEAALSSQMTGRRQRDFLLGRLAAERAVAQLGAPRRPITRVRGAPDFGDDLRGSISHSGGRAIAVAVPADDALGIGVDIEMKRLNARACARLFSLDEQRWVQEASDSLQESWRATLLFSVKESAFKAIAPSADRPPALASIAVTCVQAEGPVAARVNCPSQERNETLVLDTGWRCEGKAIVTWAIRRRSGLARARPEV